MRQDEIDAFILLKNKEPVTWKTGCGTRPRLYHATTDGLRSVCKERYEIDDTADPCPGGVWDRSVDELYTCSRCQELVSRVVKNDEHLRDVRQRAQSIAFRRAWQRLAWGPSSIDKCSSGKTSHGSK